MDVHDSYRIAAIRFQINKILNTDYPDEQKYWDMIGESIAYLHYRITQIMAGVA